MDIGAFTVCIVKDKGAGEGFEELVSYSLFDSKMKKNFYKNIQAYFKAENTTKVCFIINLFVKKFQAFTFFSIKKCGQNCYGALSVRR